MLDGARECGAVKDTRMREARSCNPRYCYRMTFNDLARTQAVLVFPPIAKAMDGKRLLISEGEIEYRAFVILEPSGLDQSIGAVRVERRKPIPETAPGPTTKITTEYGYLDLELLSKVAERSTSPTGSEFSLVLS